MRIVVGGLHIECSTYNPILNTEPDFNVLRGSDLTEAAYFAFLKDYPAEFVPTIHAKAIAGGPIGAAYYAQFKQEFLSRIAAAGPCDGVYLALHGAMYVEGLEDAEGDLIGAVRALVGSSCLIAVSYDLHGNVSQPVIDAIDIFSTYRTAPHIDVEETMRRSVAMLVRALSEGVRPVVVWCPVPVVLPGERTSTLYEPARGLYAGLDALDAVEGVWDASLMVGYVWADEPRATAAAIFTGTDVDTLKHQAEALGSAYWRARDDFVFGTWTGTVEACVDRALQSAQRPFVIADSGDNPTGGGVGDRPDVLRELLRRDVRNAIVAAITDAGAVEQAYAAGLDGGLTVAVGAALDPSGGPAQNVSGRVIYLSDAARPADRQAVLDLGGIRLVLAARRRPYHRMSDFTALGLSPAAADIVVVKSGYLSPEVEALAAGDAMALSPGVVDQYVERLVRRRKPGPLFPFDRDFDWSPAAVVSRRFQL